MSVDTKILRALRRESGSASGAELAEHLGISRAAVWARIEDLRKLGYQIEASPHEGYRLTATPDLLHADDLLARLPEDCVIGRNIQVFQETTSTNDIIERLARDGVPEGAVVFAESQTKGRGRLGRKWVSPSGQGLWFSLLLRPPWPPAQVTQITITTAVSLSRAVSRVTGVYPEIKWPNDLMHDGRKFAGILTELSAEPEMVRHVVVGIGMDVNVDSGEFPDDVRQLATSLRAVTGRAVDRAQLATQILRELDADYQRLLQGRFDEISSEWMERCRTIGREVTISMGDRRLVGRAEALDIDGALLVRSEHGRLERVVGGDVRVERSQA